MVTREPDPQRGPRPSQFIKTLAEVAAKNREPNCFELLKAAICAGSIAKGGPAGMEEQGQARTTGIDYIGIARVDYQIFQIGANIIAQASPANYPTQIVVYDAGLATGYNQSFFGVVDLPYLCQTGNIFIVNAQSSPSYPPSTTTGSVSSPGKAVMVQVPIVWNPHTPGASAYPTGLTPTKLRIGVTDTVPPYSMELRVTTRCRRIINPALPATSIPCPSKHSTPPWGNAQGYPTGPFPTAGTWTQTNTGAGYGTNVSSINPVSYATATGLVDFTAVGSNPDTEIYFDGDPAGNTTLFREPTPLWYSTGIDSGTGNFPSGTYLDSKNTLQTVGGITAGTATGSSTTNPYVTDALNTTTSPAPQYLGFFMGEFPLCWNDPSTANTIDSFNYLFGSSVGNDGSYYSLEYQVGTSWVPLPAE